MTAPAAPAELPRLVPPERLEHVPGGPYDPWKLEIAESLVRGECGWHIAPELTTVLDIDHRGGAEVVLPTLRIVDVASVVARTTGATLSGWDWSAGGVLTRPGGWPVGPRALRVTLRHGHPEASAELVGLVAELTAAVRSTTPGLRSESRSVGGVSTARSYTDTGAAGSVLSAFGHVLNRYRVRVPT